MQMQAEAPEGVDLSEGVQSLSIQVDTKHGAEWLRQVYNELLEQTDDSG